jgi:hypothetical protein
MAWLSDSWRDRRLVFVPNTGGASPVDVDVVIPPWWDDFWGAIDVNGKELRVTSADGVTGLSYSVDDGSGGAFDRAGRAGRIRIDGLTTAATASVVALRLYFDPSTTQGDGSTTTTISGALDGTVALVTPSQHAVQGQPATVGLQRPRDVAVKSAAEEVTLWARIPTTQALTAANGRRDLEEPWLIEAEIYDDTGAAATDADVDLTRSALVETREGVFAGLHVTGGTVGTGYTVAVLLHTLMPGGTSAHRKVECRIGVYIAGLETGGVDGAT